MAGRGNAGVNQAGRDYRVTREGRLFRSEVKVDSALVGVIVGGLIGLSAQILTAIFDRQKRWEEARRQVYSTYLERISINRSRLQEQLEEKIEGLPPDDTGDKERREAREAAIAGWNQVRLVTGSGSLAQAARELQIRIATLNELIEGEREATETALNEVVATYEQNRRNYVRAAQAELGLTGWWAGLRGRSDHSAY
jgi:hypothetical protein